VTVPTSSCTSVEENVGH